jgi:hypothetical protein
MLTQHYLSILVYFLGDYKFTMSINPTFLDIVEELALVISSDLILGVL